MPNPAGTNQYRVHEYPEDSVLKEAFRQYTSERLTAKQQVERLSVELDLHIGETTLYKLRRQLKMPTIRKNGLAPEEKVQAILDLKESDVSGLWGVEQTRARLAGEDIYLSREECRKILHDHFDGEFDSRTPGLHKRIHHVPLVTLGPWHKLNYDGHEKLGYQALEMSSLGLPIYGGKDQFSDFLLSLVTMPNIRRECAIGHFKLDLVEVYDYRIGIQDITDKGSETGELCRIQETLRLEAAPEYTLEAWPPAIQIPSTRNTPIEGFWRWKRNGEGHSMWEVIFADWNAGVCNVNDPLHVDVFNWLWPPLLQKRLDIFRTYWNSHWIRKQKKKHGASGLSPLQAYQVPESVRPGARDCSIRVDPETVRRLREALGGEEGRQEAFRFVSAEFQAEADFTHGALGYPEVMLASAWDVFKLMVVKMRALCE